MAVTYKDIDLLTQKSAVAGTEKIPVSDTQYLTPDQIAVQKRVYLEDESDMPASPDASTLYLIEDENEPMVYQHLSDQSEMPVSPDPNTLYLIDDEGIVYERVTNKVTLLSASQTNSQYPGAKAVYDAVHPAVGSSQPSGGMFPNIMYALGTLTGTVSFSLAAPNDANIVNHYYWTFDTDSTAPTITWPAGITSWVGGSAPTISASKHYEISVLGGVAAFIEV